MSGEELNEEQYDEEFDRMLDDAVKAREITGGALEQPEATHLVPVFNSEVSSPPGLDMLHPKDLSRLLTGEVKRCNRSSQALDVIEEILTGGNNPEFLRRQSRDELKEMYDMFSSRLNKGQTFMLRCLELGVKTKILGHLMNTSDNFFDDGVVEEVVRPEVSDRSKKLSNIIRNELDRRVIGK